MMSIINIIPEEKIIADQKNILKAKCDHEMARLHDAVHYKNPSEVDKSKRKLSKLVDELSRLESWENKRKIGGVKP